MVHETLKSARRPVIIYGAGIHLAGAESEAVDFAHATGIPVAPTWAALDVLPYDDPLFIGSFGTHGTRYGNFAVQNADLIIAVGTRLDSKATGSPPSSFAPKARIVMVDIDLTEIRKFEKLDVKVEGICRDAKSWLSENTPREVSRFPEWLSKINDWKDKYPICPDKRHTVTQSIVNERDGHFAMRMTFEINPYFLIKELSDVLEPGEMICCDTGCAVAWMSQAFEFKSGQRFIHAWNQTPMGYGLPAAVGAHYATGKRVILVTGDGSIMVNVGELATIAGHQLPIKIVLFNNQGHAMCRQTQREWLGGTYPSTSLEGGLCFPDFVKLGQAHAIDSWLININPAYYLKEMLKDDKPKLLEARIDPDCDVVPKVKYGFPNECMYPLLDPEEQKANMLI